MTARTLFISLGFALLAAAFFISSRLFADQSQASIAAPSLPKTTLPTRPRRHMAWMLCGSGIPYIKQAQRLVKSVILSQLTKLSPGHYDYTLWIFIDDAAENAGVMPYINTLRPWMSTHPGGPSINVTFVNIRDMEKQYGSNLHLFARCASAQLYIPSIFPSDIHEFMLMGADEVVVGDLERYWLDAKSRGWDATKVAALSEECVEPRGSCGWYNIWDRTHKFGTNGIHTGGSLISVDNFKKYDLVGWIERAVQKYGDKTWRLGDQDLMNRYMSENPSHLTILQCNVDVRTDSGCDITRVPPLVLHGNRQWFVREGNWSYFAARIDELFEQYQLNRNFVLEGSSLWEAVGEQARNGIIETMWRPWGLSELYTGK